MEKKEIEKLITDRDVGNQQANAGQAKELRVIFEDMVFEAYNERSSATTLTDPYIQPDLIRSLYNAGKQRSLKE